MQRLLLKKCAAILPVYVASLYPIENEPPSFIQEPESTFVFELDENGDPATLTLACDTAGEPTPTVIWFLNGIELNSSLVLEDGTLSIPNITEGKYASREGVSYYCTATNTFGTIRSRSVDVFYACEYIMHNVNFRYIYICTYMYSYSVSSLKALYFSIENQPIRM